MPMSDSADAASSRAGWRGGGPLFALAVVGGAARARRREHRACARSGTRSRTACSGGARRRRDGGRGRAGFAGGARRASRAATCCSPSTASPVERPADVIEYQHRGTPGTRLVLHAASGSGAQQALDVALAPAPRGSSMYFVLAAVGLFTLLVGASVRLRRPRDQATLHFFWLCVAFFGVVHLLVQRSVRSARLGVLLGRRGGDGAAAAAAAALHARVSRAAAQLARGRRSRRRRCR